MPGIDGLRRGRGDLDQVQWCPQPAELGGQLPREPHRGPVAGGARSAGGAGPSLVARGLDAQQREPAAEHVVQRVAVVKPQVRQPGAGPGGGRDPGRRRAAGVADDRGPGVPVAELDVPQVDRPRLVGNGPGERRGDGLRRDRAPFRLVGAEQRGAAPAVQRGGELPGQVGRVADGRAQPEAARRAGRVRGVAGQEDPAARGARIPVGVLVGEQQPLRPQVLVHDLVAQRLADRAGHRLEQRRQRRGARGAPGRRVYSVKCWVSSWTTSVQGCAPVTWYCTDRAAGPPGSRSYRSGQ